MEGEKKKQKGIYEIDDEYKTPEEEEERKKNKYRLDFFENPEGEIDIRRRDLLESGKDELAKKLLRRGRFIEQIL